MMPRPQTDGDDALSPPPGPDAVRLQGLEGFSFHQLVALVELQRRAAIPVGRLGDPAKEFLRFRASRSLSFGPADIAAMSYDAAADRLDIRVNFFGLYGPSSPLPPHYTERIIQEDRSPGAVEDLLDLFNHRLISLLHVIWRKYRYYLRYEPGGSDPLSRRFLALCGFPVEDRSRIGETSRSALLPHVGLMSLYSGSADAIGAILTNFFEIPCRIEEFVARMVVIEDSARLKLGLANAVLGEDAVLGQELDDDFGKFRVHLGPAPYEQLSQILPEGLRNRQFSELIMMICRDPLEWDMQFDFEPSTIPPARLGECRLGWSSWLQADGPGRLENGIRLTMIDDTHFDTAAAADRGGLADRDRLQSGGLA